MNLGAIAGQLYVLDIIRSLKGKSIERCNYILFRDLPQKQKDYWLGRASQYISIPKEDRLNLTVALLNVKRI